MLENSIPTIQKVVVDSLRESILDGSLKPGERLVQDDIAAHFGVSPIPVREAFRTLAAEGLVTFEQRRSVVVTLLNRADVEEIMTVRAFLEGMACRSAAQLVTPEQLEEIRLGLMKLEDARQETDKYYHLNFAFHAAILNASNRPHTAALVMKFRNMMETVIHLSQDPVGRVGIAHQDHRVRYQQDHRALFEALVRHDADEAERIAKDHTLHVLQFILADWKEPKQTLEE